MPKITDVATIETLTNDDSLFVNTGGSLRQILMNDISVGGGMMDLLWTNPNPSAEYSSQNIMVDLSGYDEVRIDYRPYASMQYIKSVHGKVGDRVVADVAMSNSGYVTGTTAFVGFRSMFIEEDHIAVNSGYSYTSEHKLVGVPYRVYGIRHNLTSLLSPSVKFDKLWTNPDPTAEFAAQTVNLDLNEYKFVKITYKFTNTANAAQTVMLQKGVGQFTYVNGNGSIVGQYRTVTVGDTKIVFNDAYSASATSDSVNNNLMIPTEIYGIKIETTPVIGGMTKKLLWENASPSSEFAAQTISIDLSEYERVFIDYAYSTGSHHTNNLEIPIGSQSSLTAAAAGIDIRSVQASKTGVTFGGGELLQTYMGTYSANNNCCIPVRIYGIKGVR